MITLKEVLKEIRERYALNVVDDRDAVVKAFWKIIETRFKNEPFREYIVDCKLRRNKLVVSVSHPAVIQEMDASKEKMIKAVNDYLGESNIMDIIFKVVPT
jgi:hypothetical protein